VNVTYGEAASFPGIAPLMLYDAETGEVRSYIGAGTAPQAATLDFYLDKGYEVMPDLSIETQLLPASPDVIIALLEDYGTMSFSEIVQPSIELSREGFPVHGSMVDNLDFSLVERIGFAFLFPYNTEVYLDGDWWRPIYQGERFTRPDLANTFEAMAQAEQDALAAGGDRSAGLQAVRSYFYEGPIAEAIVEMHADQGGLFTMEDLATYEGGWEEPLQGTYENYTIYTNQTWNQGAVVPMVMQLLEGVDLEAMGHNSPEYVHTVAQAIELTMADREAYFGDPAYVDVPTDILLSEEYAAQRRAMLSDTAFGDLPPAGDIEGVSQGPRPTPTARTAENPFTGFAAGQDTSHLAIIDAEGNAITVTPSDFPESPMVPGTGLTLGTRMNQFRLDPTHPSVVEPGKRPRVTPHAVIVFRDGEFWMAYGTPGGDMQTQALIQVLLNMVVFDMDVQQAIEQPRFRSRNFPNSFSPHDYKPGTLHLEASVFGQTATELEAMGYTVVEFPDWDIDEMSAVGAVLTEGGQLLAGSDPRENTWADGQ
jgi:gamma-glutamyltranspeptidase/glutathione hydrolase